MELLFYCAIGAAVLPHFGTTELFLTCRDIILKDVVGGNGMTMHIDNYSFGRIIINNKTYSSDVIVYPNRVDPSWWRKEGHYLNKEDLSKVVMAKPDIVIIGTGQSGVMEVPKSTVVFLESHGIKVYIEKTGRGTIQQSRQFPAVTLRQVFSGRANLLFNKIEVIEQPFAGRRNTAGALIASVKRFML